MTTTAAVTATETMTATAAITPSAVLTEEVTLANTYIQGGSANIVCVIDWTPLA